MLHLTADAAQWPASLETSNSAYFYFLFYFFFGTLHIVQRNFCLGIFFPASSQGLLFKPSGAIVWKLVYSWIDYPYGMTLWCGFYHTEGGEK